MMCILAQIAVPEASWLWTGLLVLSTLGNAAVGWAVISNRPQRSQLTNASLGVRLEDEFTPRASFHKHAELNREAHKDLEKRMTDSVQRLESSHHELAREVSALNASSEMIGMRLIEMDRKLDTIRGGMKDKS